MTVEGVDLSTIGVFTLVGLPYVWKFLWAPAMDRFVPPFLGRRRGWLLVTQVALAVGIAGMAFLSPRTDLVAIAWLALIVAFASASQDIVVDAYRTDVASREERGLAGALGVVGYRLAMLVSGHSRWSWSPVRAGSRLSGGATPTFSWLRSWRSE